MTYYWLRPSCLRDLALREQAWQARFASLLLTAPPLTGDPTTGTEAEWAPSQALPGGNTRSSLFCKPFPVTLESGSSCYVHDVDGHNYVDALGEYTASITGHSHPVVKEAIMTALDKGINLGGQASQEAVLSQVGYACTQARLRRYVWATEAQTGFLFCCTGNLLH